MTAPYRWVVGEKRRLQWWKIRMWWRMWWWKNGAGALVVTAVVLWLLTFAAIVTGIGR